MLNVRVGFSFFLTVDLLRRQAGVKSHCEKIKNYNTVGKIIRIMMSAFLGLRYRVLKISIGILLISTCLSFVAWQIIMIISYKAAGSGLRQKPRLASPVCTSFIPLTLMHMTRTATEAPSTANPKQEIDETGRRG
jgi:hypothetical protein